MLIILWLKCHWKAFLPTEIDIFSDCIQTFLLLIVLFYVFDFRKIRISAYFRRIHSTRSRDLCVQFICHSVQETCIWIVVIQVSNQVLVIIYFIFLNYLLFRWSLSSKIAWYVYSLRWIFLIHMTLAISSILLLLFIQLLWQILSLQLDDSCNSIQFLFE